MKIIILKKKKIIITILIIMFLNFLAINFAPEIITSFAFEKKKYSIMSEELKEKIKNHAEENEKIAYLTFDDGPNAQVTPKVLKILKKVAKKFGSFK